MITYGPPSVTLLERFGVSQIGLPYTCPRLGSTLGLVPPPAGHTVDRAEGLVGHGEGAFARAREAVRNWLMFDQPDTLLYPQDAPVIPGSQVTVGGRVGPLWVVGACRIIEVIDEDDRYGFAYATLDHMVTGEELFLVERRKDGSVWFSIDACSRPRLWAARLGRPILRARQHRFRQQAIARIAIATREIRTIG